MAESLFMYEEASSFTTNIQCPSYATHHGFSKAQMACNLPLASTLPRAQPKLQARGGTRYECTK